MMLTLDWNAFTPWTALAGGALIGLSAAVLMATQGRIMGFSGIVAGLWSGPHEERLWRLAFLLGLVAAPAVSLLWGPWPAPKVSAPALTLVISGLLVGWGTRLGSGCTSGHGVCGLSRGSRRSLAATLMFMATAAATVAITHHVLN